MGDDQLGRGAAAAALLGRLGAAAHAARSCVLLACPLAHPGTAQRHCAVGRLAVRSGCLGTLLLAQALAQLGVPAVGGL